MLAVAALVLMACDAPGTPTPAPTVAPTVTPAPTSAPSSVTATASRTPTASPSPELVATPTVTASPEPTWTPPPTFTPVAQPADAPSGRYATISVGEGYAGAYACALTEAGEVVCWGDVSYRRWPYLSPI